MKAVVQRAYGAPEDVLSVQDVEKPIVRDDEVLVRVEATSVHPDVWHVVRGWPYLLRLMGSGLVRPKNRIPGTDVAGRVESVGRAVTHFRPGDAVFGETLRGYQWTNGGAYAEYVAVPEEVLALKPPGVTFEQAAAVPTSGLIALSNLRTQGRLQAGQKVLVNGAGGGVGSLAVQIAKAFGAEVTGVDGTAKLETIRSLGADHVLDHTRDDFTQRPERYDLILDIPGNHPFSECRRALTPRGTYVLVGHDAYGRGSGRWFGSVGRFVKLFALSPFVPHLPKTVFTLPSKMESMALLRELLARGSLTPVVDRTYPLEKVQEAIRFLETGQVRGKVLLRL